MLLSGYEYVTVLVQEKRGECTVPYGTVRETHSTRMNFIGTSRLFKAVQADGEPFFYGIYKYIHWGNWKRTRKQYLKNRANPKNIALLQYLRGELRGNFDILFC